MNYKIGCIIAIIIICFLIIRTIKGIITLIIFIFVIELISIIGYISLLLIQNKEIQFTNIDNLYILFSPIFGTFEIFCIGLLRKKLIERRRNNEILNNL